MNRGEIWWADLAEPRGSEPGKRRPVLVVQDDALNRSRLQTAMVVPLTTNLKRGAAPGNVTLARAHTKLKSECVALVCQVLSVDRVFLTERVAALPAAAMQRVDAGLRLVLTLG
ncbi:MAG TPA: type II toxin-antitoxin system PemK/MazF family toxin [Kofleriaceae bacterium]